MKMKTKLILSVLVTAYLLSMYFLCAEVEKELTNKVTSITMQEK